LGIFGTVVLCSVTDAWHEGEYKEWLQLFPVVAASRVAENDEGKPAVVQPAVGSALWGACTSSAARALQSAPGRQGLREAVARQAMFSSPPGDGLGFDWARLA